MNSSFIAKSTESRDFVCLCEVAESTEETPRRYQSGAHPPARGPAKRQTRREVPESHRMGPSAPVTAGVCVGGGRPPCQATRAPFMLAAMGFDVICGPWSLNASTKGSRSSLSGLRPACRSARRRVSGRCASPAIGASVKPPRDLRGGLLGRRAGRQPRPRPRRRYVEHGDC